ncbi:MAG TPA: M13 family metallopeptidase [Thermoplasmata archaeon]|nr:M13 family metallopeptidase [Thermoplasmata archaeon]
MAASQDDRPIGFSVDYLDRSVDPGRDFYEFATGNWRRSNPVPLDQSLWSTFSELRRRNRRQLRSIAEGAMESSASPSNEAREVGTFYAAALDRARRDERAFGPLSGPLARVDGISNTNELMSVLAELHDTGVAGMFAPAVDSDLKHSSTYAFYLYQGGLSLPDREYYIADSFTKTRAEFERHVARMFALSGEGAAEAQRDAATVLALEDQLARASRSRTDLRDVEKNYHRFSLDELLSRYPSVPWSRYLDARKAGIAGYVVVGQPEYFEALEKLLAPERLTDWKTYLRWNVLHRAAPTLHTAADQEDFAFFHRTLLGQSEPEPDWERAIAATDECIGEALGRLYIERYFPPEARHRMEVLVADLMAVFRDRLTRLDWMTEETRTRALAKFARFSPMIGSPTRFRDYSSVLLRRDEYALNCLRARSFEVRRQMERIGGPVDREEWLMTPPTVDAYHEPQQLHIVFPAGILQPPFFDVAQDDAVNYGSIGAVIGHEITHGFDDQGRKFDADGNVSDWWSETDAREFELRAAEVEKEYSELEVLPGLRVNGKLTLGENIADIGGVSIAFEALERRLAAEPSHRRTVDGFSPEQRFCLSWAQSWRANWREEEIRRRITIDPHAPAMFRGVVPLLHLPAFFEAFPQTAGTRSRATVPQVRIW